MQVPETKSDDKAAPRVSFVSLGCPKALVDSERIITRLRAEGYELSREHVGSTWSSSIPAAFLDSAKAESLGAIGQALKENGKVSHRLHGRRAGEYHRRLPRRLCDHRAAAVRERAGRRASRRAAAHDPFIDLVPPEGIKLTPRHYAYLKISEGCNNRCTFCIIPKLRGDLVSRPAGDVLREAEKLAAPASRNCW